MWADVLGLVRGTRWSIENDVVDVTMETLKVTIVLVVTKLAVQLLGRERRLSRGLRSGSKLSGRDQLE